MNNQLMMAGLPGNLLAGKNTEAMRRAVSGASSLDLGGLRRVAGGTIRRMDPDTLAAVIARYRGDGQALRDLIASQGQDLADVARRVREIEMTSGPSGPRVEGAWRDAGISAGYTQANRDPAKGGLNTSQIIQIPDNTVAGTLFTFAFQGNDLARLRGTIGCRIYANLSGAGIVGEEAAKMRVNLTRNGVPIGPIINQPFQAMLPTAFGETRAINLNTPFSESDNVEIQVITTANLAGVGATNDVSFSIDSGGSCSLPAY